MQTKQIMQDSFQREMRSAGLRITHVRQSIFDCLKDADHPLSIQELVSKIEDAHFVSVYRSIDAMHRAGIIKQVPRGFKSLFELNDTYHPHHHHATCERCGKSTSVQDQQLESIMSEISVKNGFKPSKHTFEIFGTCENCQK